MKKPSKEKQIRCECPNDSMNNIMPASRYTEEEQSGRQHAKGKCPCIAELKKYKRGNKILWLCSCCTLGNEVLV